MKLYHNCAKQIYQIIIYYVFWTQNLCDGNVKTTYNGSKILKRVQALGLLFFNYVRVN